MITPKKDRNQKSKRVAIATSKSANYSLIFQIVSGYEIAPHIQDVETYLTVKIGRSDSKKDEKNIGKGQFPLYNFTDFIS
jgi:hypothetical protein